MKKYFMLLAAAATVLAVSCAKEKNQPKVDPTPNVVDEIDDTTPQPIRLGVSNAVVKSSVSTKAAIDDWSANEDLYIYGIQTGTTPTVYIDNVAAKSPATNGTGLDDAGHKAIHVYRVDTEPYYYGMNNEVYNFFGYYVDNAYANQWVAQNTDPVTYVYQAFDPAVTKPQPAAEGLTLPLYINGTQDIMLATTNKEEDFARRTTDVNPALVYSAKAARRGVHPDLIFKHQLSRFVVQLKVKDGIYSEEQLSKMHIAYVSIDSKYYCTMDIDQQTNVFSTPDGMPVTLPFVADNVAGTDPTVTYNHALTTAYTQFADLMVAPGEEEYTAKIKLVHDDITFGLDPIEVPINLPTLLNTAGAKAEAGKKYLVQIIVYGPEAIQIFVTLKAWDEENLGEIDTDEDDGNIVDTRESLAFSVDLPATQVLAQSANYVLPAFTIQKGGVDLDPQPTVTYNFVAGTATGTTFNEESKTVTAGTTTGEATLTISVAGTFTTKPLTKTITFTVE